MSILHHAAHAVIRKGTLIQRTRKLHFDKKKGFFLLNERTDNPFIVRPWTWVTRVKCYGFSI